MRLLVHISCVLKMTLNLAILPFPGQGNKTNPKRAFCMNLNVNFVQVDERLSFCTKKCRNGVKPEHNSVQKAH